VELSKAPVAAIEYCKKDGDYTERGSFSTQKEKGEHNAQRWKRAREAAESGNFGDIPDDIRLKYHKNIKAIRMEKLKEQNLECTEIANEWYYGETGTNKSLTAWNENPEAYRKMCNKWWDGYNGEEVVIIDDLDIKHDVLGHHLKIWGDHYPFMAEVKGDALKIRPKKIIVTSNYSPEAIWQDNQTLLPILRRFKKKEFKKIKAADTN
jgi:hypothetical protein